MGERVGLDPARSLSGRPFGHLYVELDLALLNLDLSLFFLHGRHHLSLTGGVCSSLLHLPHCSSRREASKLRRQRQPLPLLRCAEDQELGMAAAEEEHDLGVAAASAGPMRRPRPP